MLGDGPMKHAEDNFDRDENDMNGWEIRTGGRLDGSWTRTWTLFPVCIKVLPGEAGRVLAKAT